MCSAGRVGWTRVQHRLVGGCNLNRPISDLMTDAGFTIREVELFYGGVHQVHTWRCRSGLPRRPDQLVMCVAVRVVTVHVLVRQRVPMAAGDQRRFTGTVTTNATANARGERPPEQPVQQARFHRTRDGQQHRVVDDLHGEDGQRVRKQHHHERPADRHTGPHTGRTTTGSRRRTRARRPGRSTAASPQPHQVASTMPSTSPIAQPVRQCVVAETACRVRSLTPPPET